MPRDRFSLSIRVSCQIDFRSILGFFLQFFDNISLPSDGDVLRFKVVIDVDSQLAFWQIPHVTDRSDHLISAP